MSGGMGGMGFMGGTGGGGGSMAPGPVKGNGFPRRSDAQAGTGSLIGDATLARMRRAQQSTPADGDDDGLVKEEV